ncbi:hypothetical protein GOP47_0013526 [Adiantum capillus-veneris]|uniref:non-specific serine/threonine protein kinase n=1 Tax=Adiantum capillus-veneris TaxID=13818 RepID=A0A9D4ZFE2_ADICA|nr:hypothetical protein GOP47_0013526 [Adiantum capillus-veneris]
MVASLSSCADSDCCAKASFDSSGSVAGFSSSSSSSHQNHHVLGSNENASKLSCSSSSTEATSRNSWERSLPTLNSNCNAVAISKPHKAHDNAWASIQSLKSKVGAISISHFKLLCRVGHGDIGRVFLAQLRGTQCYFAMKVMDKEVLTQRKKLQRMHREREILEFVDHPFLPTLYAHFEAQQYSCLVMDYCSGGDLHALRQKFPGRRFATKTARFYAAEVLLALEYLHMLGIVYRDLKPENVLVRDDGHIMLTDFDLSFKSNVEPKLLKCPLSASSSSSSGRFGLLRSFSVSSSMSSTSFTSRMQQSSTNCMFPSVCAIHPFLSCFPLAANAGSKPPQQQKLHHKNPLSMFFLKQLSKGKPKVEGLGAGTQLQHDGDAENDANSGQAASSQTALGAHIVTGAEETLNSSSPGSRDVGIDEELMGMELIAEPTQARSMSFVGTHEYLSPEMIQGQGHGNAVDWWTFGIFLFELLYGKTPFRGSCNEQTLLNIIKQQLRFPEWGHVHIGDDAKSLIEGLLEKDPRKRLGSFKGAGEIKQHPFFRGVNWALIRSTQPPEVPNSFTAHNHQHEPKNGFSKRSRAVPKAHSHFDYF